MVKSSARGYAPVLHPSLESDLGPTSVSASVNQDKKRNPLQRCYENGMKPGTYKVLVSCSKGRRMKRMIIAAH